MPARTLPDRPDLDQYRKQAKQLLKAWRSSDAQALQRVREHHPHANDIGGAGRAPALADAQLIIAREHGFDSWPKFSVRVEELRGERVPAEVWRRAEAAIVAGDDGALARLLRDHAARFKNERPHTSWLGGLRPDYTGEARAIIAREHFFENWDQFAAFSVHAKDAASPVARYEAAADAIVAGDLTTLERLLREEPALVRARSPRTHHARLLHYVGANGVESFRQRTPPNAVQVAETLLAAGADVDATGDMYGGSNTLGLIATSIHPLQAGLQNALIEVMLKHGARLDHPDTTGHRHSLVNGCLANGRGEAAAFLASRGAPLDLEGAAGIGRLDDVRRFFNADGSLKPTATREQRRDGFTWACEFGHTAVVNFLLDHGVKVDERLPRHHNQTGLHWAALGAHADTVRVLLDRGSPVDVRDGSFNGTALGWALHGWAEDHAGNNDRYYEVVDLLVKAGSPLDQAWLGHHLIQGDARMLALLGQ